eukprot:TRINITY_DN25134_c0_g1_i1.p1 TRINITY_DN25134_c0_g1~~TRINITY_DN25134_c0_g1_i1.p1  ORF type:complete len:229 (+),score=49.63 TRINITY_DN25134_c0_g1_i1:45-689(+)
MAMESDFQYLFKVVLIGDSGVGKSNLMTRYTADEFNVESPSTIGVEFMTKSMKAENRDIKVQIWDTAGQERFRAISRSIYHGAKGAMLVYDITNQPSFDNISTWLQELRSHVQPSAVIMLIGNKCDLEYLRTVQKEQAKQFAEENNLAFLETSALDSTNVEKAFEWLVKEVYSVVNSNGSVEDTGHKKSTTGPFVPVPQNDTPQKVGRTKKCSC